MADLSGDLVDALNATLADPAFGHPGAARLVDERLILVELDDGSEIEVRENLWTVRYRELGRARRKRNWVEGVPACVWDAFAALLGAEGGKIVGDVGGESPVYDVRWRAIRGAREGFVLFSPRGIFVAHSDEIGESADVRGIGSLPRALWNDRDLRPILPRRGNAFFLPLGNSGLAARVEAEHFYSGFWIDLVKWTTGGYSLHRVGLARLGGAAGDLPRAELEAEGELASARVFLGEGIACALASSDFSATAACWMLGGDSDGAVISPPGGGDLARMPAIPVWDELFEELGAENPHILVYCETLNLIALDGAVFRPRGYAAPGPAGAAVVDVGRRGVRGDAVDMPAVAIAEALSECATPPLSPALGAVASRGGDLMWAARVDGIIAGELILRDRLYDAFWGFGTDAGELISALTDLAVEVGSYSESMGEMMAAVEVAVASIE